MQNIPLGWAGGGKHLVFNTETHLECFGRLISVPSRRGQVTIPFSLGNPQTSKLVKSI